MTGFRCVNVTVCDVRIAKAKRLTNAGRCVDCVTEGITTERKLATKRDGTLQRAPRCVSHQRAQKKVRSLRSHELRTEADYGITGPEYWAIYEAQGGCCFICRRSKGNARRLAVDHDHHFHDNEPVLPHPRDKGCRRCVRALLCKRCNMLIGWWPVAALMRAIQVLVDPPARKVLAAIMEEKPL